MQKVLVLVTDGESTGTETVAQVLSSITFSIFCYHIKLKIFLTLLQLIRSKIIDEHIEFFHFNFPFQTIRDGGIKLVGLGIGSKVSVSFLEAIIGDSSLVYHVAQFNELTTIQEAFSEVICEGKYV